MNGEIAARLKSNLFPHLGLAWSFSSAYRRCRRRRRRSARRWYRSL